MQKSRPGEAALCLSAVLARRYLPLHLYGQGFGIGNWHKLKHSYEIHRKFEFALTAEIEGLWGVFRTFVRRLYHHVTRYKLEELVAEFCLRFRQAELFKIRSLIWKFAYPLNHLLYRTRSLRPYLEPFPFSNMVEWTIL